MKTLKYTLLLLALYIAFMFIDKIYDPMTMVLNVSEFNLQNNLGAEIFSTVLLYGISDQMQYIGSCFDISEYFAGNYSHVEEVILYLNGIVVLVGSLFLFLSQKVVTGIQEKHKSENERRLIRILNQFFLNNIVGYISVVFAMNLIRIVAMVSPLHLFHEGMNGLIAAFVYFVTFAGLWFAFCVMPMVAIYATIMFAPLTFIGPMVQSGILPNERAGLVLYTLIIFILVFYVWGELLQDKVEKLSSKLLKLPVAIPARIFGFR